VNVIDPPGGSEWGKYNDRIVDADWKAGLVESFAVRLDNCTDATAMEVAVEREWLENEVIPETVEGCDIKAVPRMKLSEIGKSKVAKTEGKGKQWGNLLFLGGNHRRSALQVHVKKLEDDLKNKQKEIERVETSGEDQQTDVELLKSEAEKMTTKLDAAQLWVVRLYDRGASDKTRAAAGLTWVA
jgi:hypothetical protein